jgi:RNA polymerase sigma factor (TIGR02999 family)
MPLVHQPRPIRPQLGSPSPGEVTRLLRAARDGDRAAMDGVISLVYDDLRVLAARQLRREFVPRTMHPTSLVHEAYLKFARCASIRADDRAHFFAIAARAMRQVLVDDARRRRSMKRHGDHVATTLGDQDWARGMTTDDLLALDDAIDALEPRQRRVVECRFFGGMDEREIATALGVTERTVRRDWVKARAWLYRALYDAPPN